MVQNDINLLINRGGTSPLLAFWTSRVRSMSVAGLIIVLSLGMLEALFLFFSQSVRENLEGEANKQLSRVATNGPKESVLVGLKSRLSIIKKTKDSTQNWSSVLSTINTFLPTSMLRSVSVDEQGKATVAMFSNSSDASLAIISRVIEAAEQKKIINPTLEVLQLHDDGSMQLTISAAFR